MQVNQSPIPTPELEDRMKQYIHIKVDGTTTVVDVPVDFDAEYQLLSKLVGGDVEQVRAWGDHRLVVNETGLLRGLQENTTACIITDRVGYEWPIVGDVVLVGPIVGGDFTTVDPTVIEWTAQNMMLHGLKGLNMQRAGIDLPEHLARPGNGVGR